ncbi:MAG TPA: hypothetical protein VNQ90_10580 [Chthoniobacteraceae bacterium]|nr:hypothetical protein [Chthoniobacteraceae bacterium]
MIHDLDCLRLELQRARRAYLEEMQWLRERFGVIPSVPRHQVGPALWLALDALEANTADMLAAALKAFRKLHRSTTKLVVWHQLEETRHGLESIRAEAPELFARKLKLWNQASALFTNFNQSAGQSPTLNYRKALELLATL